jgi:hypothetical protein
VKKVVLAKVMAAHARHLIIINSAILRPTRSSRLTVTGRGDLVHDAARHDEADLLKGAVRAAISKRPSVYQASERPGRLRHGGGFARPRHRSTGRWLISR